MLKSILRGCAITFGLLIATAIVFGVAVELGIALGYFPDVEASTKVSGRHRAQLREMGVIEPGERVLYFYSTGLFSIKDDGNLFTDRRVISYEIFEGDFYLFTADYDEIESIDFSKSTSSLEDSRLTITLRDESSFELVVSAEEGGDERFRAALGQTWEANRTPFPSGQQSPDD